MQPASDPLASSSNQAAEKYDRLFVRAHARLAKRFPLQPTLEDIASFTSDVSQIALAVGKLKHLLRSDDLLDPYLFLGGFYLGQGDFDEAENWYTTGIVHLEDELTTYHASTARLMNALAILFRTKGNYDEAERMWLSLVDIKRQTPGDTTTDIITLMNNVIPLYLERKRVSDAEILIDESLKLFEQLDDKQALTVELPVYNNLASFYQAVGDLDETQRYHSITLDIIKSTLGEKHPRLVKKYFNIGVFFHESADYGRALSAYESARDLALELFGERHIETVSVMTLMAPIFADLGNPAETEAYYFNALEILRELFDENHFLFAETLWNLGVLYDNERMYENAEEMYTQALSAYRELLGERHPNVISAMSDLAVFYQERGHNNLAISLVLEAESIMKATHGKTELYAKVLQDIATIYQRRGLVDFAMKHFDEALELYKTYYSKEHLKVAQCLWAIGQIYDENWVYEKAESTYLESLRMARKVLRETHPILAQFQLDLAKFYLKLSIKSEAKSYFEEALSVFLAVFDNTDHRVIECRQFLEQIE